MRWHTDFVCAFWHVGMPGKFKLAGVLAGCLIALAGTILIHGQAHSAEQREIVIAAGSRGGTYFPMGQRLAILLRERIPGLSVKVLETSGGIENIHLIAAGKATFGFVNASSAWDAVTGQPLGNRLGLPLRSVAAISPNTMHLVVRDDAKITSIAELKGHRISTGAANSGTQIIADRIFKAYMLDEATDTKRIALGLQESVLALQNGSIDAFFFGAAIPVASIEQLSINNKLKMRLVDNGDAVRRLNRSYGPLYRDGKIPAHTYAGQSKDVTALEVWDLLVTLETTDGKLVHDIAKAVFENRADLASHLKYLDRLTPETQDSTSVISLHPGTQRFLAERGIQPFARQFGFKR
jgi:uncharacterized protein